MIPVALFSTPERENGAQRLEREASERREWNAALDRLETDPDFQAKLAAEWGKSLMGGRVKGKAEQDRRLRAEREAKHWSDSMVIDKCPCGFPAALCSVDHEEQEQARRESK